MRNIKLYTFTKYLEATLDQIKILKLTNIIRIPCPNSSL